MGATTHSFIIASRITQGHEDWETSTAEERQSIISNYLKIKDDPKMQKYREGHSHVDLLHHNDSEVSAASSQKSHESNHHLIHHNQSESELLPSKTGSKHSIRMPHRHRHGGKEEAKELVSHSATELPDDHKGIPMVHEAEIRQVMTID